VGPGGDSDGSARVSSGFAGAGRAGTDGAGANGAGKGAGVAAAGAGVVVTVAVAGEVSGVDVRFSIGGGRAGGSDCVGDLPVVALTERSGSRLAAAVVSSADWGVTEGRFAFDGTASPEVPLARRAEAGRASSSSRAGSGTTGS